MTDTVPAQRSKNKKILGVIVLVATVLIIYLSGKPILTQSRVENELQSFSQYVANESRMVGGEASFGYDSVSVEGSLFNRVATINNPRMISKRNGEEFAVSTARMTLAIDQGNSALTVVTFPEPLKLGANGGTTAQFDAPVVVQVLNRVGRAQNEYTASLQLPNKVTVSDAGSVPLVITFDPNPAVTGTFWPGEHAREIQSEFNHIQFSGANVQLASSKLTTHAKRSMLDEGRAAMDYNVAMTEMVFTANNEQTGPFAFNFDGQWSGKMPVDGTAMAESEWNIRSLSLSGDQFTVIAQGNVTRTSDDPQPVVAVAVDIKNLPYLLAQAKKQQDRDMILAAITRITGLPADSLENATFEIRREKQGAFMIGQATSDELMGSILSALVMPPQPPSDVAPSAAPAAPVEPVLPAPVQ